MRGGRSETSESSLNADIESLERFDRTDEKNFGESIMLYLLMMFDNVYFCAVHFYSIAKELTIASIV